MASRSDKPTLNGWKAIARYLGRDRTTAMRWATARGLPVHRVPGGGRASVYAVSAEIDSWMASEPTLSADEPEAGHRQWMRRTVIAGGVAAAFGAGAWLSLPGSGAVARARELLRQARILSDQNSPETRKQAIGLAQEAVRVAPEFPDAWGALGYERASAARWLRDPESLALSTLAVRDGKRALALEEGNAYGELALATAFPLLGAENWSARARRLQRSLDRDPENPEILVEQAWINRMSGHCAQAVRNCEKIDPNGIGPSSLNIWIRALWSSGRNRDMGAVMERAARLYPNNRMLWNTRIEILTFGGEGAKAITLARNDTGRPSSVDAAEADRMAVLAETVGRADAAEIRAALSALTTESAANARAATAAIKLAASTGEVDRAFEIADALYFGQGFAVGDAMGGGLFVLPRNRHTNFLFEPPTAAMRSDTRFDGLTDRLGLRRHWADFRSPPDYLGKQRPGQA